MVWPDLEVSLLSQDADAQRGPPWRRVPLACALLAAVVIVIACSRRTGSALLMLSAADPLQPLLLSDLLDQGRIADAREQSRVLIDGHFLGHAGFLAANSASGTRINQFWLMYVPCSDCDVRTAPLIHWFNGGPGSPDTIGMLNQIGSHYVTSTQQLRERCFSWCVRRSCLFVDQPVMTGFSFQTGADGTPVPPGALEYTRTSREATLQMLEIVRQFRRIFAETSASPYFVHGLSCNRSELGGCPSLPGSPSTARLPVPAVPPPSSPPPLFASARRLVPRRRTLCALDGAGDPAAQPARALGGARAAGGSGGRRPFDG